MGSFALQAGVAALSVSAQIQAAGAREVELELKKRDETSSAKDRELQRKRRLAAILGAQSAEAAARGLQLSGSVANISITDAKLAGEDSLIDSVNTRARISALSRNQKSIRRVANIRAARTIIGTVSRISQRG